MFNVSDLIEQVRDQLHEYDAHPISDDKILRKLNFAYNYVYNALIIQSDAMFCKWKYITIKAGISIYELPKDLFGKRIEDLFCPVPITDPAIPVAWVPVRRATPEVAIQYEMPRFYTYYPGRWTQMGNKIMFYPAPNTSTVFRFKITPMLIPLAKVQGQIQGISGNKLTLDKSPEGDMISAVNELGKNILSVSDEMTGEFKGLFPYNQISGTDVYLSDVFNRTTYKTKTVNFCSKLVPASTITYDPITKICTALLNSDFTTKVKPGDYVEVTNEAIGQQFNITDVLETDADPYDPPEYTVTSEFNQKGTVTQILPNQIQWLDETVVPDFTNGYPTGFDDGTYTGGLISMGPTTYQSLPVTLCATSTPHRLPLNRLFKLTIGGTGTSCNGVKKCIATSATEFIILQATFTGTYGGGTWTMFQYSPLIVTTGWPKVYDVSPGNPSMDLINIFNNSPFAYTQKLDRLNNVPFEDDVIGNGIVGVYDHTKDIAVGDWVTLGLTTGMPVTDAAFSELLCSYAYMTLSSSLNESDNENTALLKEGIKSLLSDTNGRNLMLEMQMESAPSVTYVNRSRR